MIIQCVDATNILRGSHAGDNTDLFWVWTWVIKNCGQMQ